MALWLLQLQQPSVMEGETQSAAAPTTAAPSAPAAFAAPAVVTPVVSID